MELLKEGEAMRHCVGSYAYNCHEGGAAIFSLKCNDRRCVTIEIEPSTKMLIQVSGLHNRDAKKKESEVIDLWLRKVVRSVE